MYILHNILLSLEITNNLAFSGMSTTRPNKTAFTCETDISELKGIERMPIIPTNN